MSAQPDDAMVVLLRFHGRSDELSRVAEDKRLKHSDREAVEAAQTACMLAASRIERDAATIASRDAEIAALKQNYDDLIYAVAQKWPGESRHETAKRYIIERESRPSHTAQVARAAIPSPDGAAG